MVKEVKKIKRSFEGTVVSNKADKTVIVEVRRTKVHPKYLKRYVITKRYQVHDEKNQCQEGDLVSFIECRPLSRHKRWRIIYQGK